MDYADLPDDALDEFVHGEGNVSMDGKHFPQGILILSWFHVTIQKAPHHFQKDRIVILYFNVHWKKKKKGKRWRLDDYVIVLL